MSKIILPIDTKSLYQNILNDNLSGHTATVATPLRQGKSYNLQLGRLLEIKEKELDFQEKPSLINELLKNSKSKNIIRNVFIFDKIAVNGNVIKNKSQYFIYIKEEIDRLCKNGEINIKNSEILINFIIYGQIGLLTNTNYDIEITTTEIKNYINKLIE